MYLQVLYFILFYFTMSTTNRQRVLAIGHYHIIFLICSSYIVNIFYMQEFPLFMKYVDLCSILASRVLYHYMDTIIIIYTTVGEYIET